MLAFRLGIFGHVMVNVGSEQLPLWVLMSRQRLAGRQEDGLYAIAMGRKVEPAYPIIKLPERPVVEIFHTESELPKTQPEGLTGEVSTIESNILSSRMPRLPTKMG